MSYYGSQGDHWGERAVPTQEVIRNILQFGLEIIQSWDDKLP